MQVGKQKTEASKSPKDTQRLSLNPAPGPVLLVASGGPEVGILKSGKGRTPGTRSAPSAFRGSLWRLTVGPPVCLSLNQQVWAGSELARKEANLHGDTGVPAFRLGCLQSSKDS